MTPIRRLTSGTGRRRSRPVPRRCASAVGLGFALAVACLLAPATPGLAAPIHPFDEVRSLDGFNQACGTAVDSEGDLYVASAGLSAVDIFGPSDDPEDPWDHLTSISIEGELPGIEPCGLAIDSNGNLYVTLKATGEVVKYKPAEYPFAGTPSYEAPVTIDSSGEAKGIAIDLADGRLYVARGNRVAVYEPGGAGLEANIGEGDLVEATGVAAYIHPGVSGETHYLFVADAAMNQVQVFSGSSVGSLRLRRTIKGVDEDGDPGTLDQTLEFGTEGVYVAADQGSCPFNEQACTAGHFFVYDNAHEVIDEFEAGGQYLAQVKLADNDPAFADARPTALAVDRAGGAGDGTLYVTSGDAGGAKALAFGPLPAPSRALREDLSFNLATASVIAIDNYGNRYVRAGATIGVYPPGDNTLIAMLSDANNPRDIAVDSECNVYALDVYFGSKGEERVVYFAPSQCPPTPTTTYSAAMTVAKPEPPYFETEGYIRGIGIDPSNDRVYVNQLNETTIFKSAREGSGVLEKRWAGDLYLGQRQDIDVDVTTGNVYLVGGLKDRIFVVNSAGTEILSEISGAGSPAGKLGLTSPPKISVDQANGHVAAFASGRGEAEEFELSGAFVASFGLFSTGSSGFYGVAIDNSCALHKPVLSGAECEVFDASSGNVYTGFDDAGTEIDVTAFDPVVYGRKPIGEAEIASGVGAGSATLNGTVTPQGFELTDCHFDYLTDAEYQANVEDAEAEGHEEPIAEGYGFAGAEEAPCAESAEEIGAGEEPVPVHVDIGGLDPDGRYRFRLLSENKFGICEKCEEEAGLFGPPIPTAKSAQPVSYTEASLRASVEPAGLESTYRFQYLTESQYQADGGSFAGAQNTATETLSADAGTTDLAVPVFGLAEATAYRFRVLVENEASAVAGEERTFGTLQREHESCPNEAFRTGFSAGLPDCRAYELVTPADTRGTTPEGFDRWGTKAFSNWLVTPRGEGAGEHLSFYIQGTLPGFDGNGFVDGYTARRAAGPHPSEGWITELFGPTFSEAAPSFAEALRPQGVASDQEHSFWEVRSAKGSLDKGTYVGSPAGFEALGQGGLGIDPNADARLLAAGGRHAIFSSKAHLEEGAKNEAPPAGTQAVYDRAVGESSARVVSVKPDGSAFGGGEDAVYVGATEDGATILFTVEGVLYARHSGEDPFQVAMPPNTFAGISTSGDRIFYAETVASSGTNPNPTALWMFDAGTQTATKIGDNSRFVNVAADGGRVYLTSTDVLDDALAGTSGENNLYLWDAEDETTHYIAPLDPADFDPLEFEAHASLVRWLDAVGPRGEHSGRGFSPTRTTPDGEVLIFESHAQLTPYENEGITEVYRYDVGTDSVDCVSCNPSGVPPSADATLQTLVTEAVSPEVIIPNLTEDGREAFFESEDKLLLADANSVRDVYEWKAQGVGECERSRGCLSLISSGQGETASFLYSMSPDGHDVFFTTLQRLVGGDISGSSSIYDARVEGGLADPPVSAGCQGDACQGLGSAPPILPPPASTGISSEGNVTVNVSTRRCRAVARAARRQSVRARRLRRKAGRATGKRARTLRRRAVRRAKRAKRLARRAKRCRARHRRVRR